MNFLGTNGHVEQLQAPDWAALFNDELEIAAAAEHWRVITIQMREENTLATTNVPSIVQLIVVYAMFDRASRDVADRGAVLKPRRGNARAIERMNPNFRAMMDASAEALRLERALGLTPLSRGSVTKTQRKQQRARAADAYLRPVSKLG